MATAELIKSLEALRSLKKQLIEDAKRQFPLKDESFDPDQLGKYIILLQSLATVDEQESHDLKELVNGASGVKK
jgi:hypothetical protein